MSIYQLVRDMLEAHGGACSPGQLLDAILADPAAAERLARSQGFTRVLDNMRHSGFIEVDGEIVRRTKRRPGHRHL
jgi:hypothetical protein